MAARAGRLIAIFAVDVAIGAVQLAVCLVKHQSGYRMGKIALVPAAVTPCALIVKSRNFLSGRVAGPAVKMRMKTIQWPAGHRMRKRRLLFRVVAL